VLGPGLRGARRERAARIPAGGLERGCALRLAHRVPPLHAGELVGGRVPLLRLHVRQIGVVPPGVLRQRA
jgi:hypothetical protein